MIDGWTDISNRKFQGIIACFVPNLDQLQTLKDHEAIAMTKNNAGALECLIFIALKHTTHESETSENLVKWIKDTCDIYNITHKVCGIISDKASPNVAMAPKLYDEIKDNSEALQRTGKMFFFNCTAHMENNILKKVTEELTLLNLTWRNKVTKLSVLLHNNVALKDRWVSYFKSTLPSKNETRWFSEYRQYYRFLKVAPHLSNFVNENRRFISKSQSHLFEYSESEIDEMMLLMYLMAPFNFLFNKLHKSSDNSVVFEIYYFKLMQRYLNDIHSMTESRKFRGTLGESLKSFERYSQQNNMTKKQLNICSIFTAGKNHFENHYKEQMNDIIYRVMDFLNPFSRLTLSREGTQPPVSDKIFDDVADFIYNYLGIKSLPYTDPPISSHDGNETTKDPAPMTARQRFLRSTDRNMQTMNSLELDEFVKYSEHFSRMEHPDTVEAAAEKYHHFWIKYRKDLPKLSTLALHLLYCKASSADIERTFSICKRAINGRSKLAPEKLEASVLIRMALVSFGLRPEDQRATQVDNSVLEYVMQEYENDSEEDEDDMWDLHYRCPLYLKFSCHSHEN